MILLGKEDLLEGPTGKEGRLLCHFVAIGDLEVNPIERYSI
jgi:hypothetical protein